MKLRLLITTLAVAAFFVLPLSSHAAVNKTLGSVSTGNAQDVIVVGNYAYVADAVAGVRIVNITTPSAPAIAGTYDTPGTARQIDVNGTIVYVADTDSVQILSIATPTAPQFLGSYSQTGLVVNDIVADGTHLYVAGTVSGSPTVEVLNVASSAAPVLVTSASVAQATAVTLSGNYAYVVGGTKMSIVDISGYPVLSVVGTYTDALSDSQFAAVQVFGSAAYINDPVNGLHAVTISSPAAPTASFTTTTGTAYGSGVAISNGYVFLTIASGGLAIYDIASTGSPVYVDTNSGSATGLGLTIANDVAYLANGGSGLQLIDVAKPDSVPPVVTPNGGSTGIVQPGKPYVDPGVTGTDNVGGDVSSQTTVSGKVDTSKVGKYVLTYTVTDRAGNTTTVTRVVYVTPTLTTMALKNNTLTIKVGSKSVLLRPFVGYRGTIIAKKAVLNTVKDPFYVFILMDTNRKPELMVYNSSGKQIVRQALNLISVNGLQVELAGNPISSSIYIAIAAKTNSLSVNIFNLSKSGLKFMKAFTAFGGKGTLMMKFLKTYDQEFGLVVLPKGSIKTPYVWRYGGSKKNWYRDTTYQMAKLKWSKTSLSLH